MKKLALSLILGTSLIITPSAFALNAMTDSNMKEATGQAGVSIALDDITIFQSVGQTLYTDTDGLDGSGAASISISGKETLTTYRAIFDDTNRGGFLDREYGTIMTRDAANGGDIEIAPLSIDVSHKVVSLSHGMAYNHRNDATLALGAAVFLNLDLSAEDPTDNITALAGAMRLDADKAKLAYGLAVTLASRSDIDVDDDTTWTLARSYTVAKNVISVAGVVIGLPTLEICKAGDTQTIGIASTGSVNDGKAFIETTKSDSVMAILGGTIEICAH